MRFTETVLGRANDLENSLLTCLAVGIFSLRGYNHSDQCLIILQIYNRIFHIGSSMQFSKRKKRNYNLINNSSLQSSKNGSFFFFKQTG